MNICERWCKESARNLLTGKLALAESGMITDLSGLSFRAAAPERGEHTV